MNIHSPAASITRADQLKAAAGLPIAQIIMEVKDDRRDGGDSKFETLSSEWMGKDAEGMLNRYMEKMGGSLVFPMPDEINKVDGISNIGVLPA